MRRLLCTVAICLACVVGFAGAAAASSWTVQTLPAPVVPSGQLSGVSCPSVKSCMAVGRRTRRAAGRALHQCWLEASAPSGRGGGESEFCVVLVGDGVHGYWRCHDGNRVGLALRQRAVGRALEWTAVVGPADRHPGEYQICRLNGVSCPSRKLCFAVGVVRGPKRRTMPLVERWNGSTWSVQRAASRGLRPSFANFLNGVSCVSAKACIAVGATFGKSLVERWNGSSGGV